MTESKKREPNPIYEHYLLTTNDPDPMPEHIFMFHYQRKQRRVEAMLTTRDKDENKAERHKKTVNNTRSRKMVAYHKRKARQRVRDAINARRIERGLPPIMFTIEEITGETKTHHEVMAQERQRELAELKKKLKK